MTTQTTSAGKLPILIRYRAQDYETRYLDDPRRVYIEEYRREHSDDGFVAMIPPTAPPQNPSSRSGASRATASLRSSVPRLLPYAGWLLAAAELIWIIAASQS